MDLKASLLGAIKALLAGALVGSALPSLFTLVIGASILSSGDWSGLWMIFFPYLLALGGGIIGMVVIGLPLTFYLRRKQSESARAYLIGGVVGGLVITMTTVAFLGVFGAVGTVGVMILAFGMLTGGAIGGFWWRFARRPAQMDETGKFGEIFG